MWLLSAWMSDFELDIVELLANVFVWIEANNEPIRFPKGRRVIISNVWTDSNLFLTELHFLATFVNLGIHA